jgi:tetratricopeptide (TPR) repeat protein
VADDPADTPEAVGPSTVKPAPGMRRAAVELTAEKGMSRSQSVVVEQLEWIFRTQTPSDYGIDAQIEVVEDGDSLVSGRLVALQIKSGESFFREATDTGWRFRADTSHLRYWLSHSLPVVVLLVDTDGVVYWQHVRPDEHLRETDAGFVLDIPESNRLADAKQALLDIAGQADENLELKLNSRFAVLPTDTVRSLRRAFEADAMRAARVADHLASAEGNARSAVATLTGGVPTWIEQSPAAQDLWLAIGSYAYDHDLEALAGPAFLNAANTKGERAARALAFAALAHYPYEPELALELAHRSVMDGADILGAMAVSVTSMPPNSGGVPHIPDIVRDASEEALNREPTVRNFLGECALRTGDFTEAIRQRRLAVAAGGINSHSMQIALADTLLRRASQHGLGGGRDIRDALEAATAALTEQRRFRGPSHKALSTVLDIHICTPDLRAVVAAALPQAAGGSALDREASVEGVARRGAVAALGLDDQTALEQFMNLLQDGPAKREAQALAALRGEPVPRAEERALWVQLLAEADSDAMIARCSMHLIGLGAWPDRVQELVDRQILPSIEVDVLKATHEYVAGDQAVGRRRLLDLASETPRAAHVLVERLLDEHQLEEAIDTCRSQLQRWPDAALYVLLADLLRKVGRHDEAAEHIEQQIRSEDLPTHIRVSLARWLVGHYARESAQEKAIAAARVGLHLEDDPDLAWNLVALLERAGRYQEARFELLRLRPQPQSEDETRLWMQLHLGDTVPISQLPRMVELARLQAPGPLRRAIVSVLKREATLVKASKVGSLPEGLRQDVEQLVLEVADNPEHPEDLEVSESAVRSALEAVGPSPQVFAELLPKARAGLVPWAEVAESVGHPYAAILIRRPGDVLTSQDLPKLDAGIEAARQAIAAGSCIVDLSCCYLLALLSDKEATRLLSLLDVTLPSSVGRDLALTRDGLRQERAVGSVLAMSADGLVRRETLPLSTVRYWQQVADAMAERTRSMRTAVHAASRGAGPAQEALALARAEHLALWCDDAALRQRARHSGLSAFSLMDLVEASGSVDDVSQGVIRRALISNSVLDVDLNPDDFATLAKEHGWASRGIALQLRRPQWWNQLTDWKAVWLQIALRARLDGMTSFQTTTHSALVGGAQAVGTTLAMQRFQELVVVSLLACWELGLPAPHDLLAAVSEGFTEAYLPKPGFVRLALREALIEKGVGDATEVSSRLIPGVDLPPGYL